MKDSKKGFTLIELLAVIIILAVIALIAVPLVMSTINDAKKGAAINSGYGLITAIEHGLAVEMIQDTTADYRTGSVTLSNNGTYYFNDTKALSVSYKGNSATSASLDIQNGVVVNGVITIDGFDLTVGQNGSIQTDGEGGAPIVQDNAVVAAMKTAASANASVTLDYGTTSGSGVFQATENGKNVYFFRGNTADLNNNVLFGDICWLIVRTTETGGIKMIYNGAATDNNGVKECTGTRNAIAVSSMAFNTSSDVANYESSDVNRYYADKKYVGYVYDDNGTMTASTIKNAVDTWYTSQTFNKSKLENLKLCVDKSTTDTITVGANVNYGSKVRVGENASPVSPTLDCPSGQIELTTEKAGLLSADEMSFTGLVYGSSNANTNHYLNAGGHYWLLSPYTSNYNTTDAGDIFFVASNGSLSSMPSTLTIGVRPVISLASTTTFVSGGNGSQATPYVVQ